MKKINRLMKELGFKTAARESTKTSFINYLEKSTLEGVKKSSKKPIKPESLSFPEQLSFDFLKDYTNPKPNKKSAS